MTELFRFEPQADAPVVCDFTDAPDTLDERLAEYGRLFRSALVSRERTADSTVLTFTPGEGTAAWVADLAAREAACCPFVHYNVTADDTEIRWVTSGSPEMQPILDEYFAMFEEVACLSTDELLSRLAARGFEVLTVGRERFEYTPSRDNAADDAGG